MTAREVRYLVIPADASAPVRDVTGPLDLDVLQGVVGGWIEGVTVERGCTLYCNEEGKYAGPDGRPLPRNERATARWKGLLMSGDWLAGDVVLTGPLDDDGDHLSVPDEVYA